MKTFKAFLAATLLAAGATASSAQTESRIRCGEILEGEFTKKGEFHEYLLKIEAGTQLDLAFVPIGSTLKLHAKLIEPTGQVIGASNEISWSRNNIPENQDGFVAQPRIKTDAISSRGDHRIRVYNWMAGMYSFHVTCVLPSGVQVEARQGHYVPPPPAQQPGPSGDLVDYQPPPMVPGPDLLVLTPPVDPNSADHLLSQARMDAGHADIKTQLKVAALSFAKEQAVGWLAGRLLKSAGGKILKGALNQGLLGGIPVGAGQGPANGLGPSVAQDLLVAAVSPNVSPAAALALQQAQALQANQQAQALHQAQAQALALQQAQAMQAAQPTPALQQAQTMQPPVVQQAPAEHQAPALQAATQVLASAPSAPGQQPLQPKPLPADLKPAIQLASVDAAAMQKPAGATLYESAHFTGGAEVLSASDPNLADNPIGDNRLSSIRISPGCAATLYSEIDFAGTALNVIDQEVDLQSTQVGDDSVSSIKVICRG